MLPEYFLLESNADSLNSIAQEFSSLKENHIVIKLSDNLNISEEILSLFLDKAKALKKNGMSFVVVKTGIDVDDFSEELNIVPTLQEAEDVLEMEAIERDLGF